MTNIFPLFPRLPMALVLVMGSGCAPAYRIASESPHPYVLRSFGEVVVSNRPSFDWRGARTRIRRRSGSVKFDYWFLVERPAKDGKSVLELAKSQVLEKGKSVGSVVCTSRDSNGPLELSPGGSRLVQCAVELQRQAFADAGSDHRIELLVPVRSQSTAIRFQYKVTAEDLR